MLTVTPAYNRKYKNAREVREDLLRGSQFKTVLGKLVNFNDLVRLDIRTLKVRYEVKSKHGSFKRTAKVKVF